MVGGLNGVLFTVFCSSPLFFLVLCLLYERVRVRSFSLRLMHLFVVESDLVRRVTRCQRRGEKER